MGRIFGAALYSAHKPQQVRPQPAEREPFSFVIHVPPGIAGRWLRKGMRARNDRSLRRCCGARDRAVRRDAQLEMKAMRLYLQQRFMTPAKVSHKEALPMFRMNFSPDRSLPIALIRSARGANLLTSGPLRQGLDRARPRTMDVVLRDRTAPQRGLFCDPAMLLSTGCGSVIAGKDMLQ